MTDIAKLVAGENNRWRAMHLHADSAAQAKVLGARLVAPAAKARYQAVEARTGVPWDVIAVIHEREASQSWARNIAQGDPWNARSTHVPVGRGPFSSWEEAAVDALFNCAPYAARWKDWSIGGILALLEQYNGLGYFLKGVASPYDWAGTDQYTSGKYVADHDYRANVVDHQLGCACLLAEMALLDPSIQFGALPKVEAPSIVPDVAPEAPVGKPVTKKFATKAGTAVVAGAGAVGAAAKLGFPPGLLIGIAIAVAIAVAIIVLKNRK